MMDLQLTGKTAVVCGSTQGIGHAAAVELADLGANVILLARNAEALQRVLETLPRSDDQVHRCLVADFAKPDEVRAVAEEVAAQPCEILVNNTGGPPGGPAIDAEVSQYEQAFRLHLVANQLLTQTLVPGMKSLRYGRIINVISTSVKQPIVGLGVSNTIRGAVASWAKTLATELGPFGITVNNVLPGFTDTARLHTIIEQRAAKTGLSESEVADRMRDSVPAQRFGEAAEVGGAIAFLATPAAGYINGINLPIDGGRTTCL